MNSIVYGKLKTLKNQYHLYQEYKNDLEQLNLELNNISKDIDIDKVNILKLKISELTKLVNKYNKSDIDVITKFLDLELKFQEISDYIKEVEIISKKLNDGKAQMLNAEGRKKYINVTFVNEYSEKVKEKKEIMKQMNEIAKKAMRIDTLLLNDIDSFEKNLSKIEKLEHVNENVKSILKQAKLPNQGKKIHVTIEGEKVDFPKKLYGLYQNSKREQKKCLEELNKESLETSIQKSDNQNIIKNEEVKSEEDNNLINKQIINQPNTEIEDFSDLELAISEKKKDSYESYLELLKTSVQKIEDNDKFVPIDLKSEEVCLVDHIEESEKIVNLKHGKVSLKRKMKFKSLKAILTASIALISTVVLISNILPNKKVDTNTIKEFKPKNSSEQMINLDEQKQHNIEIDEIKQQDIAFDDIEETDIDKIVLNDSAMIYKDSYSAFLKNESESLTPYYGNKTKEVSGVTFAKEGRLITIYKSDPDFEKKYHELLESNASIRSYLTSVNGEYEGFFNADDVKEKSR